jgi:hypothetical protein
VANADQVNAARDLLITSQRRGRPTRNTTAPAEAFQEIGTSGLRQYGGFVTEEWLQQLAGRRAAWVWREMLDNDPTVGAIMFAIRWLARGVEWRVEEGNQPEAAELVESAMHDMSHTWGDFVSEALSVLPYGWGLHETVYKRRQGTQPIQITPVESDAGPDEDGTSENDTNQASSRYKDGRIGWRKLPIRAQETLLKWDFDGYSGIQAMQQVDYHGGNHIIPIEKAVLFRTQTTRGNPEGRALALDTPIPTPDGWKTMADLEVGSRVFDETGRIRYVTATADWDNRPCHELTFSDGSTIVADENHQWLTQTVKERYTKTPATLRTTSEISATSQTGQHVSNHSIQWAGPLDYTPQHLAIDPYLLGLWLGDGTKTAAQITCHADDVEEQAVLVEAAGYATSIKHNGAHGGNGRLLEVRSTTLWRDSPQASLRALNVLENKHLPDHYLRGSFDQRLAVLQGLMDSDGHVDSLGRCSFTNTNLRLIDAVAELVRSLGCGCRVNLHRPAGVETIRGRVCEVKDAWTVKFTPTAFVPFRLARKAARVSAHAGVERKRQFHYITGTCRVENRRTRCIEVDAPSHMFLAGRSLVPTHNSILRNAYTSYFALKNIKQIEAIGVERDLAGIPVAKAPEGVDIFSAGNQALYQKVKAMVTGVRNDEYAGLVLPPGWEFELLSSGGSKQMDTDKIVRRYRQDIATSMLADFVLIGQDSVGSFAMVDVKSDLFGVAIDGILDLLCEVMNRYAVPRLLALNGMDISEPPRIEHGSAGRIDIEKVGTFLFQMAGAGAPIPWSKQLMESLLSESGLPSNIEEDAQEHVPVVPEPTEDAAGGDITPDPQPVGPPMLTPGTDPFAREAHLGTPAPQPATTPAKPAASGAVAKADTSKVRGGVAVDVSSKLRDRHTILSAQLEQEITAALGQLGIQAATAYQQITHKASSGMLHRLVARVMAALGLHTWVDQTLKPILANHASRVIADTQRTIQAELTSTVPDLTPHGPALDAAERGIQTQIDLQVGVANQDAERIIAGAGDGLGMRDIEPQIRQNILEAIKAGLARGENPMRTADRIRADVPAGRFVNAGAKYRARLIARDQTSRLMRAAAVALYQSNPSIVAVELQDGIFGEPRSDADCIARSGEIVPVSQAGSVQALHPQCTLMMNPVVGGTVRTPEVEPEPALD